MTKNAFVSISLCEKRAFVQNVHNTILMPSASCFFPADIIRVTQEVVMPGYLVILLGVSDPTILPYPVSL